MHSALRLVLLVTALAVAGLMVQRTSAEPKENAPASALPGAAQDRGDWTISPPRAITVPGVSYFHASFTTTLDEMERVGPELEELFKTIREADIDLFAEQSGYVTFVYKGVQADRSKPFQLSIGITVPRGTQAVGKYEVKDLPDFKCAAAAYNGPLSSLPAAYQKHYGDLMAAGHMPTDEVREVYLYWEGFDSANNVVWIQAGIQ